jgi:hypothetical protein
MRHQLTNKVQNNFTGGCLWNNFCATFKDSEWLPDLISKSMRKLIIILTIVTFIFSCEKSNNIPTLDNMDITSGFVLDNAIIIAVGDCAGDARTDTYICFDSVPSDSRCPEGVVCFWQGNGEARFKFVKSKAEPVFFNLNTYLGFTNDTIIGGYKFTLKSLKPYPSIRNIILPKSYKAEIEIEKAAK